MPKLVTHYLTFECANHHRTEVERAQYVEPGSMRELDDHPFPIDCPVCGWKGVILGRDRVGFRSVE